MSEERQVMADDLLDTVRNYLALAALYEKRHNECLPSAARWDLGARDIRLALAFILRKGES